MKYYIETDINNEFVKLHLEKHILDELVVTEMELLILTLLITNEYPLDILVPKYFSTDLFNHLINIRVVSEVRCGNSIFYKLKNRYYRNIIAKHYSIILSFVDSAKAEAWALRNGYFKFDNMITSTILD